MKNIILIISLFSCQLFLSQIYPLDTTSPGDLPDNAYIKDTNNTLDKYVGLWKGIWNGKTLFIELKKIKVYRNGNNPYYIDKILGERKIIGSNGAVEVDRITNFNVEDTEIVGIYNSLRYSDKSTLSFYPKSMCNKDGDLEITDFKSIIDSNTGQTIIQMTLKMFFSLGTFDVNCPHNGYVAQYSEFPVNFPKDIVLIKQ
jgi:hypothetical protein